MFVNDGEPYSNFDDWMSFIRSGTYYAAWQIGEIATLRQDKLFWGRVNKMPR